MRDQRPDEIWMGPLQSIHEGFVAEGTQICASKPLAINHITFVCMIHMFWCVYELSYSVKEESKTLANNTAEPFREAADCEKLFLNYQLLIANMAKMVTLHSTILHD